VLGNFFAAVGLRLPLPFLRFVLSTLTVIAALLTFSGIVAALATKNDALASKLLPYYPRYLLSSAAMHALEEMSLPLREGNVTTNLGIVSIDEPAWPVLLAFIESETAIRKSERTEALIPQPLAQQPAPPAAPPAPPAQASPDMPTGSGSANAPPAQPTPLVAVQAPPINFNRVKTVISVRNSGVISAGTKALVPPYNLLVLWPGNVPRRVYEFLSFEEFRLDFRKVVLDEIGEWGLWLSAFAFVCGLVLNALRALVASAEQRELASRAAS
jgi:hypothetical protein